MKRKSMLSLLISVVLAVGLMPVGAFADTATDDVCEIDSATDQDECPNSWRYADGALVVGENSTSVDDTDEVNTDVSSLAIQPLATGSWCEDGYGNYLNSRGEVIPGAIAKGIDVSEHNGTINWEAVKADGIDFAIIRIGRIYNGSARADYSYEYNVSECERLGIPYGVYLYSYAQDTSYASREADLVISLLEGHNPSMPVYYDMEESSMASTSNRSLLASIATTFCSRVENAGYFAGVYANLNWWNNYLTDSSFNNWDRWVAQWNYKCDYTGTYNVWQCASGYGYVDGVSGEIDLDFRLYDPVDINRFAWYYTEGAYSYVTSSGLMTGYSNKVFGTFDSIKRADVVTILWRMAQKPIVWDAEPFEDVNYSAYYGDAIAWARSEGIISGYLEDGTYQEFKPDAPTTREEFATMLARYARIILGRDTSSDCVALSEKVDAYKVAEFAYESMGWAVDKGIITGNLVNGTYWLNPQDGTWRASAMSMVYRFSLLR